MPDPMYQTNGKVDAVLSVGDTIYIGGTFTSVRPAGAPAGTDRGVAVQARGVLPQHRSPAPLEPWRRTPGQRLGGVAKRPDHLRRRPLHAARWTAPTQHRRRPRLDRPSDELPGGHGRQGLRRRDDGQPRLSRRPLHASGGSTALRDGRCPIERSPGAVRLLPHERCRPVHRDHPPGQVRVRRRGVHARLRSQEPAPRPVDTQRTGEALEVPPVVPRHGPGGHGPSLYVSGTGPGGHVGSYTARGARRWVVQTDGNVQALAVIGTSVYAGGNFDHVCVNDTGRSRRWFRLCEEPRDASQAGAARDVPRRAAGVGSGSQQQSGRGRDDTVGEHPGGRRIVHARPGAALPGFRSVQPGLTDAPPAEPLAGGRSRRRPNRPSPCRRST